MSSYLRSWIYGQSQQSLEPEPAVTLSISPPQPEDDDDKTETGDAGDDDNDIPPAFPALNSAQRASSTNTTSLKPVPPSSVPPLPRILTDTQLMPPPPLPASALRVPGAPQPKASSMLQLPPTTTKAPVPASKRREKVALAPGFGPLDWAKLKSSGVDLRVR